MSDAATGWAEGEVDGTPRILRTTDGGATWRDISPQDCESRGLTSTDAELAWVGVFGVCLTTDGGQNWEAIEAPDDAHTWFNDGQHGWTMSVVQWGLSFRQFDIEGFATTDDGGMTWTETNPPPGAGVTYMAYPDAHTAWALRAWFAKAVEGVPNLSQTFHVHVSFDRGKSWTTRQVPLPEGAEVVQLQGLGTYLAGVGNCEFASPSFSSRSIWKFALTCEEGSWLYTSANQGRTWIISPMPAGVDADVHFIDPSLGWLHVADWEDGQGRLYSTTDGGQTWTLVKRTAWLDVELSFVDAADGWAVVCDTRCPYIDAVRALVKTSDGGRTWHVMEAQLVPK